MSIKSNVFVGYADTASEKDHLGVSSYFDGLTRFIENCTTPMTISIQGDWGTGKTTALKLIENRLLSDDSGKYYVLWFRTWQYVNFGIDDSLTLILLDNLCEKLKDLYKEKTGKSDFKDYKIPVLQGIRKITSDFFENNLKLGNIGARTFREIFNAVFDLENTTNMARQIEETHDSVQKMINDVLEEGERLIIFIDDLDRLEPQVAIELLEGVKNFMDCDRCVFVLAVDPDVIEQGVFIKYGSGINLLHDESENKLITDDEIKLKAKKFFDKIIQVPFNLPAGKYDIKEFLAQFIGDKNEEIENYESITRHYLNNNPRAIKRAFNLLQLYNQIYPLENGDNLDKLGTFAILAIQIYDKRVYNNMLNRAHDTPDDLKNILGDEYEFLKEPLKEIVRENREDYGGNTYAVDQFTSKLYELLNASPRDDDYAKCAIGARKIQYEYIPIIEKLIYKLDSKKNENGQKSYIKSDTEGMSIIYRDRKNRNKRCMINNKNTSYNITIYSDKADLNYPKGIEWAVDKAKEEDVPPKKLGFYYSKDHITFVGITSLTDEESLYEAMRFYGILS